MLRPRAAAFGLSLLVAAAIPAHGGPADPPATGLRLTRIASGLDRPVDFQVAPDDRGRFYVAEQSGRVRVIENGRVRREPFLDLHDRVTRRGNEQGLLGLAFHPRYASNGYLYASYTDPHGDTRVERYTAARDRASADPASAHRILAQDQPFSNHNGGQVLFGPDGMLYVPLGDGGAGGDPGNRAQDLGTRLGKILRLDVDHGDPYAIPRDNPFAAAKDARPEIWAYGVRNPWRIAFDAPSGLLYVADVGQDRWEEVDVVRASRAGLDYGWPFFEGTHDYRRGRDEPDGLIVPLVEYGHGEGCSVTGGVVYRGRRIPALAGAYLYSDFCSGWLRSFRVEAGRAIERHEWRVDSPGQISAFGVDHDGEVYVVSLGGTVSRIDPAR